MSSRESRQGKKGNNVNDYGDQSTKNVDVDNMLANVDQFIESVYRDLSITPPSRSAIGNSSVCPRRSLNNETSSSSSNSPSSSSPISGTTLRKESTPAISPLIRRNLDAEIDRINRICDSVDQNLRSIGLLWNSSSPSSVSEAVSNINLTQSPSSSAPVIVPSEPQERILPPIQTVVESVVDLCNSQTPELIEQTIHSNNVDDDDDVILVSTNIPPVVDLCTPGSHVPTFQTRNIMKPENLNRRRLHSNDDEDEAEICCGGPSLTRRRRTETSLKPLQNCSSVGETSLVTNDGGRTPFMCPVCMDSCLQRQPTSTVCGHVFCKHCIEQAIAMTHKCPLCNKRISRKQTFRIYF